MVVCNIGTAIEDSKWGFTQHKPNAKLVSVALRVYYGEIALSQSLLRGQKFSSKIFSMSKYSYGPLMSTHAKEIAK